MPRAWGPTAYGGRPFVLSRTGSLSHALSGGRRAAGFHAVPRRRAGSGRCAQTFPWSRRSEGRQSPDRYRPPTLSDVTRCGYRCEGHRHGTGPRTRGSGQVGVRQSVTSPCASAKFESNAGVLTAGRCIGLEFRTGGDSTMFPGSVITPLGGPPRWPGCSVVSPVMQGHVDEFPNQEAF